MNKRNECEARLESFAQQGGAVQDENKPTSGYQSYQYTPGKLPVTRPVRIFLVYRGGLTAFFATLKKVSGYKIH